jgi:hypothetical protein
MANNLEQLIIDLKESLERELHSFRSEMTEFREEVRSRFDGQAVRMDHQFGLLESGRRRIARMDQAIERLHKAMEVKDKQISELAERIRRLEEGRPEH